MYSFNPNPYEASNPYDLARAQARRGTLVGQVMGLLAFSLLFTAGGAVVAPRLGFGGMILSIVGSIACLIALFFVKTKPGLNLGLFYGFSAFEGIALGLIVDAYVARGLGAVVVNAAATTAGLVLALGAYAWTTKRDLSGLGGFLFAGLLAVIVAGIVGFFVQSTIFHLILSIVTAVLFSGFVLYDLQRLKHAEGDQHDATMMAVAIYLDIFNLFLAILRIFGIFGSSEE